MRRMLERLIGEDIELVTELEARHPIFSDPGQIEQVILNLAINSRDAMPSGGRISLSTADVTLTPGNAQGLDAGEYVSLVVSDTGCGIPADVLPHIFEPFFTTKEVGRGTGLGLSMVEGIVQQSGWGHGRGVAPLSRHQLHYLPTALEPAPGGQPRSSSSRRVQTCISRPSSSATTTKRAKAPDRRPEFPRLPHPRGQER